MLTPWKTDWPFVFVAITHTTHTCRHFALIAVVSLTSSSCYYRRSQCFDTSTLKTQNKHWRPLISVTTSVVHLFIAVWSLYTPAAEVESVCVCVWVCVWMSSKPKSKDKKSWSCVDLKIEMRSDWWCVQTVCVTLCNSTILTLPFSLSVIQWKE